MSNKHIQKLQHWLESRHLDAIVIERPADLYYLTGQELSTGVLVATPRDATLLVDSRYYESCKKQTAIPVALAAGAATLGHLFSSAPWQQVRTLAFDSAATTYDRVLQLRRCLGRSKIKVVATPNPIAALRSVKGKEELAALRRAAKLGSEGFDFLCSQLREGVTELELVAALDTFWREQGGTGHAFAPIIAFGTHGSMPHYHSSHYRLRRGHTILFDIGVQLDHYCSDMTRVVSFGPPKQKIAEIHAIAAEAQEAALAVCKSGVAMGDVDAAARDVIARYGYGNAFCHSLGHGIGLEVHEAPYFRSGSRERLEAGMVITIEPGIYLKGVGGVRIEDTIAITASGYENLTKRSNELLLID